MQYDSAPTVAMLGLGMMGAALGRAFVDAGHRVSVWNRTADRSNAFVDGTAVVATSVEEALAASDLIVVCVRDYAATDELLGGHRDRLAGKTIIQFSTGTPDQAKSASRWITDAGADYLDGAILGFPQDIGTEALVVLWGGPSAAYAGATPIVDALGGTSVWTGDDAASASVYDASLLSLYFSLLFGALQGAAIVDRHGGSQDIYAELGGALIPTLGGIVSRTLGMIRDDEYASEYSTLATSLSALTQIAAVGSDAGIDTRFAELMRSYAAEGAEAGWADLGNASLFRLLRGRADHGADDR